jgi:hypothetical protein
MVLITVNPSILLTVSIGKPLYKLMVEANV